ncbi:hypothetical protein ACFY36_31980 [Actinoplanes sp. NPDC000266]
MPDSASMPAALTHVVDAYMWRVLEAAEDPVEVVAELQYELTEPPSRETAEQAGRLYLLFANLGDIADGGPVSGRETEERVVGHVMIWGRTAAGGHGYMSWMVVALVAGVPVAGAIVLLAVIKLISRRARAGVRSGRNTARPGNSWNNF